MFSRLKRGMNYSEARREARKRFGENAEVHRVKSRISEHQYEVGVVINNKFLRLGGGGTWVEAFETAPGGTMYVEPKVSEDAPKSTG